MMLTAIEVSWRVMTHVTVNKIHVIIKLSSTPAVDPMDAPTNNLFRVHESVHWCKGTRRSLRAIHIQCSATQLGLVFESKKLINSWRLCSYTGSHTRHIETRNSKILREKSAPNQIKILQSYPRETFWMCNYVCLNRLQFLCRKKTQLWDPYMCTHCTRAATRLGGWKKKNKQTIHIVEPMERAILAVHAHVVLIGIMRNLVYWKIKMNMHCIVCGRPIEYNRI